MIVFDAALALRYLSQKIEEAAGECLPSDSSIVFHCWKPSSFWCRLISFWNDQVLFELESIYEFTVEVEKR